MTSIHNHLLELGTDMESHVELLLSWMLLHPDSQLACSPLSLIPQHFSYFHTCYHPVSQPPVDMTPAD